jgi:hypothetical protein
MIFAHFAFSKLCFLHISILGFLHISIFPHFAFFTFSLFHSYILCFLQTFITLSSIFCFFATFITFIYHIFAFLLFSFFAFLLFAFFAFFIFTFFHSFVLSLFAFTNFYTLCLLPSLRGLGPLSEPKAHAFCILCLFSLVVFPNLILFYIILKQ